MVVILMTRRIRKVTLPLVVLVVVIVWMIRLMIVPLCGRVLIMVRRILLVSGLIVKVLLFFLVMISVGVIRIDMEAPDTKETTLCCSPSCATGSGPGVVTSIVRKIGMVDLFVDLLVVLAFDVDMFAFPSIEDEPFCSDGLMVRTFSTV